MEVDSPFGPRRPTSLPAGPVQVAASVRHREENSRRFGELKPICVELLKHAGSAGRPEVHAAINDALQRALTKLQSFGCHSASPATGGAARIPLSPALISYVFYPLAQLLRTLPDPPDRIRRLQFLLLACLADDWWQEWVGEDEIRTREQWKVWEQLLVLGATTLNPRPGELSKHSEETVSAILSLLQSLLAARVAEQDKQASNAKAPATRADWEWDGEADLPDLDDYDAAMQAVEDAQAASDAQDEAQTKVRFVYPSSQHVMHTYSNSTCRGALAHVLSASLDLARSADRSRAIKREGLHLAQTLLQVWTAGRDEPLNGVERLVGHSQVRATTRDLPAFRPLKQAERFSTFLPGVISTLVRICAVPNEPADVVGEALQLFRMMLVTCLSDDVVECASDRSHNTNTARATTLESLIAQVQIDDGEPTEMAVKPTGPKSEEVRKEPADTSARVAIALQAISKLSAHQQADVQKALSELSGDLLLHCHTSLSHASEGGIDAVRLLLGWLIDIGSNDTVSVGVERCAHEYLINFLRKEAGHQRTSFVSTEIVDLAQQMPRLLTSMGQDAALSAAARRFTYLIRITSGAVDPTFAPFEALDVLLNRRDYERWTIGLISSLAIDHSISSLGNDDAMRLQGLETATSRAVMAIFHELGAASGRLVRRAALQSKSDAERVESLVEHLMRLSAHWRQVAGSEALTSLSSLRSRQMSVNALLVAKEFVAGLASILDDDQLSLIPGKEGGKLRKQARRIARGVISSVTDMWQTDEEELLHSDLTLAASKHELTQEEKQIIAASNTEPSLTEYSRGLQQQQQQGYNPTEALKLGPAVNVNFVEAATIRRSDSSVAAKTLTPQQRRREAVLRASRSDALLLSIMASSAKILGPSLKPMLVQTIYPIVCAVASPSDVVRGSAGSALQAISYAAGYASVQGCLLDHADYVLGAASHRLVSTLGQELQRRSSLSLTTSSEGEATNSGSMILSDGAHSYCPLMSALSAPLVLVQLIRMLGTEVVVLVEDAIDEVLDAIDRFHADPDICDGLLSVLDRMLEVMLGQSTLPVTASPSPTSYQPDNERDLADFTDWYRSRHSHDGAQQQNTAPDPDADADAEAPTDEPNITRSQQVTVSMLKKAVPFLSHPSRTIRMRCLRLISQGVELLCRQGLTAEPLSIVNTLWPILMSRLGFNLSRPLEAIASLKRLPRAEDMDESDFFVAIEAVKLVATLARNLVQFVGSEKMLRQAVPRLLLLLRIMERAEQRPSDAGARKQRSDKPTTFLLYESRDTLKAKRPTSLVEKAFRPLRPHSPLAILLEHVITTLDTLVRAMGPSITEADLYAFASHPSLISCLDARQIEPVQRLSRLFFYQTLSERNAGLAWFIVQAATASTHQSTPPSATPAQSLFPSFLWRPELSLNPSMYF